MLYTRRGDDGTTKKFGCDQRISKSSKIAEALGTVDEINSFLGICKTKAGEFKFPNGKSFKEVIHQAQENLFIVQAEIAGSEKFLDEEKVKEAESLIDQAEKELPPINTFFISGETELGALFDFGRTISRRAERRVVEAQEEGKTKIGISTLAYLNRLSSLLYAMARLTNHFSGIKESGPSYK